MTSRKKQLTSHLLCDVSYSNKSDRDFENTTCLLSIIVNLALSANRTTVSEFKLVPPKNLLKKIILDWLY